jgi:hypothetical protein
VIVMDSPVKLRALVVGVVRLLTKLSIRNF